MIGQAFILALRVAAASVRQHTNQLFPVATSGQDNNLRGGLFGGTYGYNWQFGHLVAGLEGDFSWSGIRDTFTSVNGLPTFCPAHFRASRACNGLARIARALATLRTDS